MEIISGMEAKAKKKVSSKMIQNKNQVLLDSYFPTHEFFRLFYDVAFLASPLSFFT